VTQTVTGELTLHGVTNTVEIEVEGALQDGLLVVVGSTEIQFAGRRNRTACVDVRGEHRGPWDDGVSDRVRAGVGASNL
jgi:hypothetical protein